jgi:hypothetical protein
MTVIESSWTEYWMFKLSTFNFFGTRIELELFTELENLLKLYSFIFWTNSNLFTSYSINLVILYIKYM